MVERKEEQPKHINISRTELSEMSEENIATLIAVTSIAFDESAGESIQLAWKSKKDQTVFVSTEEESEGFLILDNSLAEDNIYYVELVAVVSQSKGVGTTLHGEAVKSIQTEDRSNFLLSMSNNPAEIMSFRSALSKTGEFSFPVDRRLDERDKLYLEKWLEGGPLNKMNPKPVFNYESSSISNLYRNWQPKVDAPVREGDFSKFLELKNIDYNDFIHSKSAFVVGGFV